MKKIAKTILFVVCGCLLCYGGCTILNPFRMAVTMTVVDEQGELGTGPLCAFNPNIHSSNRNPIPRGQNGADEQSQ